MNGSSNQIALWTHSFSFYFIKTRCFGIIHSCSSSVAKSTRPGFSLFWTSRMIASPRKNTLIFSSTYDLTGSYRFQNYRSSWFCDQPCKHFIAGISAPWFQQFLDQTEIAIRIPAFGLYLFERNPAYRHCWLSQMQFFFNSLIALFSPAFAPVFSESGITGYPLRKFKVC